MSETGDEGDDKTDEDGADEREVDEQQRQRRSAPGGRRRGVGEIAAGEVDGRRDRSDADHHHRQAAAVVAVDEVRKVFEVEAHRPADGAEADGETEGGETEEQRQVAEHESLLFGQPQWTDETCHHFVL